MKSFFSSWDKTLILRSCLTVFHSCVTLPPLPCQNSDGRCQKSTRLLLRFDHNHLDAAKEGSRKVNIQTSFFRYVLIAGSAKSIENIVKRRTWTISLEKISLLGKRTSLATLHDVASIMFLCIQSTNVNVININAFTHQCQLHKVALMVSLILDRWVEPLHVKVKK